MLMLNLLYFYFVFRETSVKVIQLVKQRGKEKLRSIEMLKKIPMSFNCYLFFFDEC